MKWHPYSKKELVDKTIYVEFTSHRGVLILKYKEKIKRNNKIKTYFKISNTDFKFDNIEEVINKINYEF